MKLLFGASPNIDRARSSYFQGRQRRAELVEKRKAASGDDDVYHLVFHFLDPGEVCTPDKNVRVLPDHQKDPSDRPRDYSTSGDTGNGDTFSLCVRRVPEGVVSGDLTSLKPGDTVDFEVLRSEFPLPKPDQNVIMVANGTGISAFRGFMQYMACQPGRTGTAQLIFGVQDKDHFLYRSELCKWAKAIRCKIEMVYSDQASDPKRKYVQHRFEDWFNDPKQGPKLIESLRNPKTHLYICGHRDLGRIEEMLQEIPAVPGRTETLWERMKRENRLHVSVY